MKFVTANDVRAAEAAAIAERPELGMQMMNRAGQALSNLLVDLLEQSGSTAPLVRFLAGPGNNGGDALVAASNLTVAGIAVDVWLTCPIERLEGDAKNAYDLFEGIGGFVHELDEDHLEQLTAGSVRPTLLVDALLGTGARGEPRGLVAWAMDYLNSMAGRCPVVAVDIPTGMDAETGQTAARHVRADYTLTMEVPKAGMASPKAFEALGSLWCAPVGLPTDVADALSASAPDLRLITVAEAARAFPRRARDGHKGIYGTVGLIGGAEPYPGAMVLAAEGANRSGAGLVKVWTSPGAVAAILARAPETIVFEDVSADTPLDGLDAILVGPGLGQGPESRRLVLRLLREASCPVVLDADAINVLEGRPEVVRDNLTQAVLTPHPGELARLLGKSVLEVQADRLAAVREAAERTDALVILKGAGTLIVGGKEPTWLNLTGNPGMACGGSGDVLAGLLAGFLARGVKAPDAARAAVWLHGTAGDIAALRLGEAAMKAGDIVQALPAATRWAARNA